MANDFLLNVDEAGKVIGELLKKQRREILEHMERRFRLLELRQDNPQDKRRQLNFHRRITELEHELRMLRKGLR